MSILDQFHQQTFANGYEFIDGVAMHEANGDSFHIPPDVMKKYVGESHFVELRLDSPRFSAHPDAPEKCECSTCNGETSKPVLSHDHPQSLVELPRQDVPSRGWGEDFWVRVTDRDGDILLGTVDNHLHESRLHEIQFGQTVAFHVRQILAIHPSHRQEMVMGMDEADIRKLVDWLGSQ